MKLRRTSKQQKQLSAFVGGHFVDVAKVVEGVDVDLPGLGQLERVHRHVGGVLVRIELRDVVPHRHERRRRRQADGGVVLTVGDGFHVCRTGDRGLRIRSVHPFAVKRGHW